MLIESFTRNIKRKLTVRSANSSQKTSFKNQITPGFSFGTGRFYLSLTAKILPGGQAPFLAKATYPFQNILVPFILFTNNDD